MAHPLHHAPRAAPWEPVRDAAGRGAKSVPPPAAGPRWDSAAVDTRFSGITEMFGIALVADDHNPLVGRSIGEVTLASVIAEGGMWRVYEGRQRCPDQPVAVNVLSPGFITPDGIRRFACEAELLGTLRHPHIAQVCWTGVCGILGSAMPFIVMEFVPGALSITAYAREHGLDTAARIALFRKACDAVAQAHAAGIVHRDLKPGNVLVDSAGEPKPIDFGIARIADDHGSGTAITEIGCLMGTVQYMSPEHITNERALIAPRTDVHALGLILHERVSGRRPYEIDARRMFDAARVIRQLKPVSLTVADGRQLAPDLGPVEDQCLAFDPGRRYPDATAVAAAVALAALSVSRPEGQPTPRSVTSAAPAPRRREAMVPPAELLRPLTMPDMLAARSDSGTLTFHDVSKIPPEVATALVGRGLRLRLYDMPAVSTKLAMILGRQRHGLELHGVRRITPETAASLAPVGGPLCLDAVGSPDAATARILATHQDRLNLAGPRELPADVLGELVHHSGQGMAIGCPGTLDRGRAEIIARHRGMAYLLGVDTVEPAAARALSAHRDGIVIQAEHLTPEVDRLLAELD